MTAGFEDEVFSQQPTAQITKIAYVVEPTRSPDQESADQQVKI